MALAPDLRGGLAVLPDLLREVCDARAALPGLFGCAGVVAAAGGGERDGVPDGWTAGGADDGMWIGSVFGCLLTIGSPDTTDAAGEPAVAGSPAAERGR